MAESLPPLNQLRVFEAAARHLSFKLAAEEMNVTPAAIGQQVRALESFLQCRLFTRHIRQVALTTEGQLLFDDISVGLGVIKDGISRHLARQRNRTLRVSSTNSFTELVLLPALPEFTAQFPNDNVRIISTDEKLSLIKHEADVCIRLGTGRFSDCESYSLGSQLNIPVCSPDFSKKLKSTISPQMLLNLPLIEEEWTIERAAAPSWENWMLNRGVSFAPKRPVLKVSLEAHAVTAALHGQGVALVGSKSVERLTKKGDLIELRCPEGRDKASFNYHVIWRKGESSENVLAFVDWVKESLDQHPVS